VNHPAGNWAGYSPSYPVKNPENNLAGYPASYWTGYLPENPASYSGSYRGSNSAGYSADCRDYCPERNPESNGANNLLNYSESNSVCSLPDCPASYLTGFVRRRRAGQAPAAIQLTVSVSRCKCRAAARHYLRSCFRPAMLGMRSGLTPGPATAIHSVLNNCA